MLRARADLTLAALGESRRLRVALRGLPQPVRFAAGEAAEGGHGDAKCDAVKRPVKPPQRFGPFSVEALGCRLRPA